MKKSLLLVVLVSILLLTGCNGTVTRELRGDGFNLGTENIVCSSLIPKKEGQVVGNKIKYMNDNFAYTEDGYIYDISLSQKYSNNENCKKANTSIKVAALMDNNIARGTDGNFYYMTNESNSTPYSKVGVNDDSYEIYKLLLSSDDVKRVITVNSSDGVYYALFNDGNVYKYVINRANYDNPYSIQSKTIKYSSENYGGKIIDFNYDNSVKEKIYVKTENAIYRMKAINKEKCEKYADVSCKYKIMKDEVLTKYYKTKIVYYGPTILVTSYGRTFN